MRYLVTGGAGFVGSHLVDALLDRGDRVLALDDLSTGTDANLHARADDPNLELVRGSTLDEALVAECVDACDAVFHLASAVGVQLIVNEPVATLTRNVRSIDIVLSTAARLRRRLLFTSTSEIYGKNSAVLDEGADRILGSPFRARWAYSTAKAFGEALAHGLHTQAGSEMVVARLFNTVGPRQSGRHGMVIPRFVADAGKGDPVTVYGDGRQTRCFCHVADTVRGLVGLMDEERATGQVFNVGSDRSISILDLALMVIDRLNSKSQINVVPYSMIFGPDFEELGRRIPDCSAIADLLGWTPVRSLESVIDEVHASLGGSPVEALSPAA